MTPSAATSSGRNKLLHRFYEPLVLLFALDPVQGEHQYSETHKIVLSETTNQELRRLFLKALCYICDYEKGGDTVTAIGAATGPLSYYVASNTTPNKKVKTFLEYVFSRLEQIYDMDRGERPAMENEILMSSARFSRKRIQTYWRQLKMSLEDCCTDALQNESMVAILGLEIRDLTQQLENSSGELVDLCRYCYALMRSEEMDFIKDKAEKSIDYRKNKCPFVATRHRIGRLAFHVKNVKILVAAAERLPGLVVDPQIILIDSPGSIVLPPSVRSKLRLNGIAKRMVPSEHGVHLSELRSSLQLLDHKFNVEKIVRKQYLEKKFKARVHAELIVLEYFYEREETLQFLDNDPFIGCSKPACYCCSLYFREHPAHIAQPDTHQKIYLNWLPPTSVSGVEQPKSRLAIHEAEMLNRMVQSIRSRTIYQIRNQTGRRLIHFDSTTGETASTRAIAAFKSRQEINQLLIAKDDESDNESNGDNNADIADEALSGDVKHSNDLT